MHIRHHTPHSGARHPRRSDNPKTTAEQPKKEKRRARFGAAVGVVMLVIASIFIVPSVRTFYWTRAIAVVVTSETESYPRNSQQGTVRESDTTIEYTYQVGGIAYTGTGIYPTDTVAENGANPVGIGQIWIFYNPRNPGESRIAPSLSVVGVVFAVLGIIFLGGQIATNRSKARDSGTAEAEPEKGA